MKRLFALLFIGVFYFCCALSTYGQQVPAASVKLFFEKIYLHTDRAAYAAGDTIWYKAYLADAQTAKLRPGNSVLYVELLSQTDSLLTRQIIKLSQGTGYGDMLIPDSVAAGNYRIRAYTNWMRNFGAAFVFEKQLFIDGASATKIAPFIATDINLGFYPEGGAMVNGIAGMVAVKAEDLGGRQLSTISGSVIDPQGDTVARFRCDSLGMGLFSLLPLTTRAYKARFIYHGKAYSIDLPAALQSGITMQVVHRDNALQVAINCNTDIPALYKDKPFTLMGRHAGKVCFLQQINLSTTQQIVWLPYNLFTQGITALSLYDDKMRPHAERLVFIQPSAIEKIKVSLSIDKSVDIPSEETHLSIALTDGKGKPVSGNLSLAVVENGLEGKAGIQSYMLLQSELKGVIDDPERYFDAANPHRYKQLDLLLLTQGWRNFLWRRLADTSIRISFAPETGLSLSGRVTTDKGNKPLPWTVVTLSNPGALTSRFLSARTDSAGRFNFGGMAFADKQNILLRSINNKGKNEGNIRVDNVSAFVQMPIRYRSYISLDTVARNTIKQVFESKPMLQKNITLKEVKVKASRTVTILSGTFTSWGNDQVFDITEKDNKYKTLEWYLLQNAKGARQSNIADTFGIVLSGVDTNLYYLKNLSGSKPAYRGRTKLLAPQLFINGRELIMTENNQAEVYRKLYYMMPIEQFKRIVLKRVTGTLAGGMANERDLRGSPPAADILQAETQALTIPVDRYLLYLTLKEGVYISESGTLSVNMQGFYEAREFYKPAANITQKLNSQQAFKPTLYWQPNVYTDLSGVAKVSFTNLGYHDVKVVVQGITNGGMYINASAYYVIK